MSTYLITGGAGFIGTNLSERLVRDGHAVRVVDDLSSGKAERLPKEVEFHKLNICDTQPLTDVMRGVDVVVHLAALPRVQFSIEHPFEAQRVNVDGTLSVLEAAREAKVRRIVYAASSSAYGFGEENASALRETMPVSPKSPYALHKYYGEVMMKLWHEIHGLETVSLRFFNVYGPHLNPDGAYALVIGKFLKQRKAGEAMTITGDGEQSRDFTHVSDIVEGLVRASQSEKVGKGEVFNTGAGRNVTINELAKLIGGPIEYIPARFEPRHSLADTTSIRTVLGWEPKVTIEEGIVELKKIFDLT